MKTGTIVDTIPIPTPARNRPITSTVTVGDHPIMQLPANTNSPAHINDNLLPSASPILPATAVPVIAPAAHADTIMPVVFG